MSDPVVVPNDDPAAIESGNSWNGLDTAGAPVIVTFSFPTSPPAYDTTIRDSPRRRLPASRLSLG